MAKVPKHFIEKRINKFWKSRKNEKYIEIWPAYNGW